MRLWSINPQYLDAHGLVALWREGLLAQKVLQNLTKGYKNHPQLNRFKKQDEPLLAIGNYLWATCDAADERAYNFARSKIILSNPCAKISVTQGQINYEWQHFLAKLQKRSPPAFIKCRDVKKIKPHPLFNIVDGDVEDWERN